MTELRFNTIINYLTHSCEAAVVTNGSEMPLLCCHNPELFSGAKTSTYTEEDHSWQNAFHRFSADSSRPQVCFMARMPLMEKFRSKFN